MGLRDIIFGRRPNLATTPPFMPGGYPGLDISPGSPGILGYLRDGIMAASQPNIAGGGALDVLRAISGGMGMADNRRQQELQQKLAAMEMSRKMQNDGILAQARLADAERDRARASLDLANANKRPQSIQQRFDEAMALLNDREKAMAWALNGKLPEPAQTGQTIAIDPRVARDVGLSVPVETVTRNVQVPTTDPENDPRMVEANVQQMSNQPLQVSPSVATAAIQTWSRMNRPQGGAASGNAPRADLRETANGWMYFSPKPDGTVEKIPVGERSPDRRRFGSGGGSRGSGGGLTPSRAKSIESSKQRAFRAIQKDIAEDQDLEASSDRYIQGALDAQRAYEEEIVAGGGQVSDEDSARNAEAVRAAFSGRIRQVLDSKKPSEKKASGGFFSWGGANKKANTSEGVAAEYVIGRGLVRR